MKKSSFKLLLVLPLFLFISCGGNGVTEPDQIGRQVFDIFKNLSTDSKDDYVANFLTIEEMRELGKNQELITEERTRNDLTSMTSERWKEKIESSYNKIKEKGAQYGIQWQEIEYLDFIYEVKTENGLKGCKGELYFKSNDESYKSDVLSVFDGSEYKLTRIKSLTIQ